MTQPRRWPDKGEWKPGAWERTQEAETLGYWRVPLPDVRSQLGDAGIEESSSRNGLDLEWMMKPAGG